MYSLCSDHLYPLHSSPFFNKNDMLFRFRFENVDFTMFHHNLTFHKIRCACKVKSISHINKIIICCIWFFSWFGFKFVFRSYLLSWDKHFTALATSRYWKANITICKFTKLETWTASCTGWKQKKVGLRAMFWERETVIKETVYFLRTCLL